MIQPKNIAVYSCSGFGREVAWLLSTYEDSKALNFLGYIEDDKSLINKVVNEKKVFSFEFIKKNHEDCLISVAIGKPKTRFLVVEKCIKNGFKFATLIHHNVEKSKFITIGDGTIICGGSILTVNIDIGRHVHINLDCTIGHDVKIGDYTTLSPGVHVSGNVYIEDCVFIGTGASIINGTSKNPLIISSGTVIGAGTCVTKSTEPNSLYVGVPAIKKK